MRCLESWSHKVSNGKYPDALALDARRGGCAREYVKMCFSSVRVQALGRFPGSLYRYAVRGGALCDKTERVLTDVAHGVETE